MDMHTVRSAQVWSMLHICGLWTLLHSLTKTAQNLEKISGKIEPATTDTIENLNETLYNISDAMKSFRNLTDYLEQYPESLLKGKKK